MKEAEAEEEIGSMGLKIRDEALLICTPHACCCLGVLSNAVLRCFKPAPSSLTSLGTRKIKVKTHDLCIGDSSYPRSIPPSSNRSNTFISTSDCLEESSWGKDTPTLYQRSIPEIAVRGKKAAEEKPQ